MCKLLISFAPVFEYHFLGGEECGDNIRAPKPWTELIVYMLLTYCISQETTVTILNTRISSCVLLTFNTII